MIVVAGARYRVRRAELASRGAAAIHRDLFLDRLRALTAAGDPEPAQCMALARFAEARGLPELQGLALRFTLLIDGDHREARRELDALRARLRTLPVRPAAAARLLAEATAEASGGPPFRLLRTPHLRVAHQLTVGAAQRFGDLLEKVHGAFFHFFRGHHLEPVPPTDRLEVVIFGSREAYRRFVTPLGPGLQHTAGLYSSRHHRSYFFDALADPRRGEDRRRVADARSRLDRLERDLLADAGPGDTFRVDTGDGWSGALSAGEARRVLARQRRQLQRAAVDLEQSYRERNVTRAVHEITHHLAYAAGIHPRHHPSPRWLVEGLAMYFEASEGERWAGPGRPAPARLARMRARIRAGIGLSIERLTASDAPFEAGPEAAVEAYDAAWALFWFLAATRRDALFDYVANLSLRVAAAAEPPAERRRELARAFGPLPPLEREWLRFVEAALSPEAGMR